MKRIDKAYFFNQGRALYSAGLIIFFGAPRSWQHAAKINGYKQARSEWLQAHPEMSEWDCAKARSVEFCKQAIAN